MEQKQRKFNYNTLEDLYSLYKSIDTINENEN
jgi:hypothetical protein